MSDTTEQLSLSPDLFIFFQCLCYWSVQNICCTYKIMWSLWTCVHLSPQPSFPCSLLWWGRVLSFFLTHLFIMAHMAPLEILTLSEVSVWLLPFQGRWLCLFPWLFKTKIPRPPRTDRDCPPRLSPTPCLGTSRDSCYLVVILTSESLLFLSWQVSSLYF